MERVTVGLLGEPRSPPPGAVDWTLPWDDLPKVDIEVHDRETLAVVLNRAGGAFRAVPFFPGQDHYETAHWVAFDDSSGLPIWERRRHELTLLDRSGGAVWGVSDWAAVPLEQLRETSRRGLLHGNPSQIVFIRQIPQGDLGYIVQNWRLFLDLWDIAIRELEQLGKIGEDVAGTVVIWHLLHSVVEVVERLAPAWAQRGAKPGTLATAFPGADDDELARRLGCTPSDARIVRSFFEATGGEDPVLTAIWATVGEAERKRMYIDGQALVRERVRTYVEVGLEAEVRVPEIDLAAWLEENSRPANRSSEQQGAG